MGRFLIANSAMPTTAMSVKQPTGNNAIRTQLQIAPSIPIRVCGWSISFDGTAAATPVQCSLLETGTVNATGMTALAAADVTALDGVSDELAIATLLSFGTGATAFATGAVTEGSTTATRRGDIQQVPPSSLYSVYWPLNERFFVPSGRFLRVLTLAPAAAVNCFISVIVEPA